MTRNLNPGWYALRYEILERDEFTCRYCGRSAPSVPLEVDHVVAVADGGTDDPSNLVTCCWSCNRGKEGLRARRTGRQRQRRVRASRETPRRSFSSVPCGECGAPSDTIHIVRWVGPDWDAESKRWVYPTVKTACTTHDPGGYWLAIQELAQQDSALHWLRHLGNKRGRPDRLLAEWLRNQPVIAHGAWTLRCIDCRADRPWPETDMCTRCSEDVCVRCLLRHTCDGDDDEPPTSKIITAAELGAMEFPESVAAMWNGKQDW